MQVHYTSLYFCIYLKLSIIKLFNCKKGNCPCEFHILCFFFEYFTWKFFLEYSYSGQHSKQWLLTSPHTKFLMQSQEAISPCILPTVGMSWCRMKRANVRVNVPSDDLSHLTIESHLLLPQFKFQELKWEGTLTFFQSKRQHLLFKTKIHFSLKMRFLKTF